MVIIDRVNLESGRDALKEVQFRRSVSAQEQIANREDGRQIRQMYR